MAKLKSVKTVMIPSAEQRMELMNTHVECTSYDVPATDITDPDPDVAGGGDGDAGAAQKPAAASVKKYNPLLQL